MPSEPNDPNPDDPQDASPVAVPPYEDAPSSTGLVDAEDMDVEDEEEDS
jgi:hypothetical protein